MKLAKGGHHKQHIKMYSEDLNKSSNTKNYFISKLLNQSSSKRINTDTIETENLGNFKTSIQNIFSNDDKRKKAIQYVIKIRKEREKSPFFPQDEYLTVNKNLAINTNNAEIKIIKDKANNKQRNSNRIDISNDKKEYKTLEYNFYNLYNERTFNKSNHDKNEAKKKSQNKNDKININENKRNAETIQNNDIKRNIFLTDKYFQNYKHNKIPSNNNILKNYQNYGIYTNKNEKNYNMMKIKSKILNIQNQDNNYQKIIPKNQNNQNQALYNTQINFNYNTNKKYYVNKNLVYSKLNNQPTNNKELISKSLLNNSKPKQRVITLNDTDNNLRTNKIIIEKIFNPKKLSKINSINLYINPRKNKKMKLIKNNLILCQQNKFELINKNNKKEFNFMNEQEMFNYIRNKYDDLKIKKIFNLSEKENEYNRLKKENKNLKNEIEILKDENEQCKIELTDIRNQYNDLNKEYNIAKEENEKLKDNFINNMIEEDNSGNPNLKEVE